MASNTIHSLKPVCCLYIVYDMLYTHVKRSVETRQISGKEISIDNIKLPDMLHIAVLRSPYGHARINGINTEGARNHPGVVAVYTAEDVKGAVGNVAVAAPL